MDESVGSDRENKQNNDDIKRPFSYAPQPQKPVPRPNGYKDNAVRGQVPPPMLQPKVD